MTAEELQAYVRPLKYTDYPEIVVTFSQGRTPGWAGMNTHGWVNTVEKGRLVDTVKSMSYQDTWVLSILIDPWTTKLLYVKTDWDCITLAGETVVAPPSYAAGTCPKCGDRGEWIMLALFCKNGHGRFAG